ncbi:uncharacterized protein LOC130713196 [Lotus japonicus]|uniref:uncharacterized protein LOC130713196 n=1 Tax=Lotus japonicus TaxID=34305 RepID=UPI0025880BE7|nr:uncharacterized protein LOC130713196 [Lotus japonicus]
MGGSVLLSEARALKLGLQLAWDRGFRDVRCNVDCSDLLLALVDEDSRNLFPILSDIHEMSSRSWKVVFNAISRDCNQPADWLVKKGASSPSMDVCLLEFPPSELEILVLWDRLAIP